MLIKITDTHPSRRCYPMGEDPTTGAPLSHSWMLRYSQGRDYQEFYMEINVEKEFIHYSVLLHTKLLRTPLLDSGKIFFLKLNKKKKTSSFHSPLFAVQVLTNYLERFLRHRCFFCFRNRVIDKNCHSSNLSLTLRASFLGSLFVTNPARMDLPMPGLASKLMGSWGNSRFTTTIR